MLTKQIIYLFFLLIPITVGAESYSKIQISYSSIDDLNKLAKAQLPIDDLVIIDKSKAEMILNSNDLEILKNTNLDYTILIPDMIEYYRNIQKEKPYSRANDFEILRQINIDQYPYGSYGGYHRLSELENLLDELHAKYPNLMSSKFSIGKSHNNKDIWAYKLSDNVDSDESLTEGVAYYDALHHAREMNSLPALILFTLWLLENYNKDPLANHILNNRELYFVPIVNPDGYYFNEVNYPNGGGMWRKNRRDNGDGTIGVDINRNYSYGYGLENGSDSWGGSETYRGPNEFSEPEAVAVRDLIDSIKPATANIIHTKAGRYLIPYTFSDETPQYDIYSELTIGAADENNYLYGNCKQILNYYSSGTTIDYLHSKGIYCWLPELRGANFWAPKSEILPVATENLKFNQMIALAAGSYPVFHSLEITDKSSENEKKLLLKVNVKNRGFENTSSKITVRIRSLTMDLPVNPFSQEITNINSREIKFNTEPLIVDYSYITTTPSIVKIEVLIIENETTISKDTINIMTGESNIIFEDNGNNGLTNWTSSSNNSWDTTSLTSYVGKTGFTDSRNGNGTKNLKATLTLNSPISLNNTINPALSFAAKWSTEDEYDGASIQISSDNGQTWTNLQGLYTSSYGGGIIGYTGTNDWINEIIDLSDYVGKDVRFRFRSFNDGQTTVDGFYFDNFKVIDYKDFETSNIYKLNKQTKSIQLKFSNRIISIDTKSLSSNKAYLNVYSLKGEKLFSKRWTNLSLPNFNENIKLPQKLSAGLYLATFHNGNRKVVKPLIIK